MKTYFQASPLGQGTRSGLAQWNAVRGATALEVWQLLAQDVQSSAGGAIASVVPYPNADPATRVGFAAQSPAAAVAAAAALGWGEVDTWASLSGPQTVYPGFGADGYQAAMGGLWQYTPRLNGYTTGWTEGWGFSEQQTEFEQPDGLYPMAGGGPGFYPAAWPMSFFCFTPDFQYPAAAGAATWNNIQSAGRTRYRLSHPYQSLPVLRLNAEIWVQTAAASPVSGPASWSWGATPGAWSAQWTAPGSGFAEPLRIVFRNWTFAARLQAPSFGPPGSMDVTDDWMEIPLPSVPTGWDAAGFAAAGKLGVATLDFFGFATRGQWQAVTGEGVGGEGGV